MKRLLLFAAAALALAAPSAASSPAPPTIVFLLAGQSNMLGRGMPISSGEASNARLLSWRETGWNVAVDPLGGSANADNGVGPGMTFGLAVAVANPGVTVGLIQCAHGGTSIKDWQPAGKWYTACIAKVRAAGVTVAGVLFLQGETDATKKKWASAWCSGFANVAAAFRLDLHARILLGQIGKPDAGKYPYQGIVRDQQTVAAAKLGLPLVKTSDLAVNPADGVHFTVASYKVVGARFAAAWVAS